MIGRMTASQILPRVPSQAEPLSNLKSPSEQRIQPQAGPTQQDEGKFEVDLSRLREKMENEGRKAKHGEDAIPDTLWSTLSPLGVMAPSLEAGAREAQSLQAQSNFLPALVMSQGEGQSELLKPASPLQSNLQSPKLQATQVLGKDLLGQTYSSLANNSHQNLIQNSTVNTISSDAVGGNVIPDFSQWSAELQSIVNQAESNPVNAPAFVSSNPLSGSDYLKTMEQLQSVAKNPSLNSKLGLNQTQAALGTSGMNAIGPDGKFEFKPRGTGKDLSPGFRYLDGSEIRSGVQAENGSGVHRVNPWDAVLPSDTSQQTQFQFSGQSQNQFRMPERGDPFAELGLVDAKKKIGLSEDRLAGVSSQAFLDNSGGIKNFSMPVIEVNAQVTTGSGAKQRLATESLMNMSGQIRNLASSGGGEIRVRLKPNDLGELNIRVMTQGSRVGIQIQAADEKAKKMIEDSVGYLKESLSAQNLSLSRVDLSVLSTGSKNDAATSGDSQQNTNAWNMSDPGMQQNSGQFLGRHEGQGSRSELFSDSGFGPTRRTQVASPAFLGSQRMGQRSAGQGRIDVTA